MRPITIKHLDQISFSMLLSSGHDMKHHGILCVVIASARAIQPVKLSSKLNILYSIMKVLVLIASRLQNQLEKLSSSSQFSLPFFSPMQRIQHVMVRSPRAGN